MNQYSLVASVYTVMDSDGETVYRVPQFNMVAHGTGHVGDEVNEGQVSWVSYNF